MSKPKPSKAARPPVSRNLMDRPPGVQCTARSKRTGERCKRPSILGGNVCYHHGGNAPQTRASAAKRLQQSADVLVQRLLSFAIDGTVDDAVALRAMIAALDRAGLTVAQTVEINGEMTLKPWQEVVQSFSGISPITREQSRTARGLPTAQPALESAGPHATALADGEEMEIVDAEIVQDDPETRPDHPVDRRTVRRGSRGRPNSADGRSGPQRPYGRTTDEDETEDGIPAGYVSMEKGLELAAEANRRAGVWPSRRGAMRLRR